MEWKEVDICQLCDSVSETYKGNASEVVLINTSDVLDGKCLNHEYVPNKKLKGQFKKTFRKGDILYSEIRPANKRFCFVDFEPKDYIASTKLMVLRAHEDVDPQYLYQILRSNDTLTQLQMLAESRSGTFPQITYSELSNIMVSLPSQKAQKNIVSILSSLDRKIELNNKINADLEEMAQAIFKNWFVDFEPFKDGKFVDSELGMIPEGWKVISLSEIMKYNGGSQPPASEFIDTYQEGYIRFIQIRDYDNDSHITYIPISKRNKLCDELDIMIARYGAALGRICWGLKGAYNVALAKVIPIKSYYREYLRCYLNTSYFYQSINNKGARCAQSGFNQSDINSYMIAFPIDETVVMNFNDLCSSIMDKRLSLKYENSRLSSLRDTLLPRLMSGELEVPE